MESILISAAMAMIVFVVFLLLMPQRIKSDAELRKQAVLGQVSQGAAKGAFARDAGNVSLLKELPPDAGIFAYLPGAQSTVDLLVKAGLWRMRLVYILSMIVVFLLFLTVLRKFEFVWSGVFIALVMAWWLPRKYLRHRIFKRNEQFLNLFPDTVDMIVRSVRSGHPLNTAMRMIVENVDSPVREEFKQVVDEISLGRTLPDALARLANRIDEADLNFFVVVLSVQQETGGNLAEVLSNLSSIIRRRRQLRLKIRALTSEGRATSYVLGALPILEFAALYFIAPHYLTPLFETFAGNIMLGIAAGLVVTALWIVRRMVDIDI